ncbi:MAG TPA: diacylglycerol kinase family protein [Terriglobia bacterium]|nr:diacylglycerol kinase family protein [Terriglobia bacterium]
MKLTILFNPAAGRGRARRMLGDALEVLRVGGVEPQIRESRDARHLVELARQAARENPDVLVSAGGDGTHHGVLNGIFGSEVALGMIPLGTGNIFAAGLGIPADPRLAAAILLAGRTRQVDVARVGPTVYGCVAGVGFDSVVTRFANERVRRLRGRLAYAWAILRCLRRFRAEPLELRSEVRDFSGPVVFAVVGNHSTYGGGVKIAPLARMDDGLLDVCIVPPMPLLELLRWIPRAYRGEHLAHPRIVYFQAKRVSLASPSPSADGLELFGDGEFICELPATIEVAPRSVKIVVPE